MAKASEMTILQVSNKIQACMKQIAENVELLDELADKKALSSAEYDKQMAISVLKLKEDNPVTVVEKLAKGECCEYKYTMDYAEAQYKLTMSKIESYKSILNGWQSISKHLENV
jgi:hypothetical protein